MKRLILFRHAKSDWDDPVARDFDRPLNGRGEKAALVMGEFARAQNLTFDMVVASPAVRVMETLNVFFTAYGDAVDPHWDRRIYLASTPTLMDVIRDLPDTVESVLMSGHNPGLEELVLDLVPDDGASPLREDVEVKFPTASMAVLDLPVEHWSEVKANIATLASFTRPRDLDPALGPNSR